VTAAVITCVPARIRTTQMCADQLTVVLQAVLHKRYALAALAAAAAVGVRQNNAIWSAFSLGVSATCLACMRRCDQCCELGNPPLQVTKQHSRPFCVQVAVLQECKLVEPVSKGLLEHVTAVVLSAWQVQSRSLLHACRLYACEG
jgi:DIE2/ALG10 family